ncbi:MAG: TatD family hydrolase, partial [Acidobacteria bacterium]|nr:TatD family hydrolase [Acidobacteriota bacterium]
MFVDSHAHLDERRFESDRDEVLVRAQKAGVLNVLAIGTGEGPQTLSCAIELAARVPFLYATIGIHPHEAKLVEDSHFRDLERLSRQPKVIAWGEIGLDYYYDHSPRETQKMVFVRQMELAAQARLPIVIHCRPSNNSDDAWIDCLGLIDQHWKRWGLGGVLHCFTGTWEHARRALDWGFLISFAGNVTFPKAREVRESASRVPLEAMLIET